MYQSILWVTPKDKLPTCSIGFSISQAFKNIHHNLEKRSTIQIGDRKCCPVFLILQATHGFKFSIDNIYVKFHDKIFKKKFRLAIRSKQSPTLAAGWPDWQNFREVPTYYTLYKKIWPWHNTMHSKHVDNILEISDSFDLQIKVTLELKS